MKTVVAIGDLHCGHFSGLTPPAWQIKKERAPRIYAMEQETWQSYRKIINKHKNPDVLIVNGDCMDGKGARSGGTELIASDLDEQADMAIKCIQLWGAKKVVMTYGTGYHVSSDSGEDMEKRIASFFRAEIHGHCTVQVGGVNFNVKHHLGSSQIPWGRHTSVSRERVQNMLWADKGMQPRGNVFLRSHVHFYNFCGGSDWLAMTLPALQGPHTKFGARRCSGTVDWGAVWFKVDKGQVKDWGADIINLSSYNMEVIKC